LNFESNRKKGAIGALFTFIQITLRLPWVLVGRDICHSTEKVWVRNSLPLWEKWAGDVGARCDVIQSSTKSLTDSIWSKFLQTIDKKQ